MLYKRGNKCTAKRPPTKMLSDISQSTEAVALKNSLKRYSSKFRKIHKKTPVPEFSLIKTVRPATSLKKRLWHRCFFCEFGEIFINTFFYRTPPVATSESSYLSEHSSQLLLNFKHFNFFFDLGFFPHYLSECMSACQVQFSINPFLVNVPIF